MKESMRKCLKCGRSPAGDPAVKLFRFPQPGIRNTLRCETWAKYCFPDKECSTDFQTKLYQEHRMLCDQHFAMSSFVDFTTKKLHRWAVPEDSDKKVIIHIPNISVSMDNTSRPPLVDVTNQPGQSGTMSSTIISEPGPSHLHHIQIQDNTENQNINIPIQSTSSKNADKQKRLYIKCRKAMKKVCQLRNRIHKLNNKAVLKSLDSDDAVNILTNKITPTLALILQGEIMNFKRKSRGRRWSKELKITALRLYKRSPTCYHLLRRLFCLPAQSTLKTLLRQIPLSVGINEKLFHVLKKIITNLSPSDNEFMVTFDEMSIRKHLHYNKRDDIIEGCQDHASQGRTSQVASHALVFMVCGIRKSIKQPIAYYFSASSVTADRLAVIIKEVLRHCLKYGVKVTATVCDMDGVNRRALAILGATLKNPCIELDSQRIVTIFDPPHLLKCFRNLFMKYDIEVNHLSNISSQEISGKGIAKWTHIKQFYDIDNLNPNFVFAPTLRQEHISPNTRQKMRVKLAAQILSHSVAAGMFCKISQGELPAEAIITASLVSNIDKLFDCLNSSTPDWRRGKPHATNMTKNSPHIQIFKDMKVFFETMQLIGCRTRPPSVDGWVWTLNAMGIFWRELTIRHPSVRSLATRRLQQDPLENLFGCIRGHCGSNTNPTAGQFIAGLKTAVLSKLSSIGASGSNCEADENEAMINHFKVLITKDTAQPTPTAYNPVEYIQLTEAIQVDQNEVSGEIQACAYICGFMIKKYKKECAICTQYLLAENIDLEHNFINMKEFSSVKRSLIYASKEFIKFVEYCATTINNYLETNFYKENLKNNITNSLITCCYSDFFKCTEHKQNVIEYVVNSVFFISVMRFCTLKNRKFIEEASVIGLRKKINILKHN